MVLVKHIQDVVHKMKTAEWKIEINYKLPTVTVTPPEERGWFFQGDEANCLIEEAESSALAEEISTEDIILWIASSW